MAASSLLRRIPFVLLSLFLVSLLLHLHVSNARKLLSDGHSKNPLAKCHFNKIYQLGDSISDTGNLVIESPHGSGFLFSKFPYGETFGKPTGRCSNGLLMIDYFALASGLPYLNPYKKVNANFDNGVNFAVAGATALSSEVLKAKGFPPNPATNSSLDVQLKWMSSHFASTCHTIKECHKMFKKSLFMVGEIGGNDLNYALIGSRNMDALISLIPDVVDKIIKAVRDLKNYKKLVVGVEAHTIFPSTKCVVCQE